MEIMLHSPLPADRNRTRGGILERPFPRHASAIATGSTVGLDWAHAARNPGQCAMKTLRSRCVSTMAAVGGAGRHGAFSDSSHAIPR